MSHMILPTELEKTKKDLAALKEQAAGLTRAYDRLLEEHSKAQVGGEGRVYYLKTPSQEVPIWRTSSFFFQNLQPLYDRMFEF